MVMLPHQKLYTYICMCYCVNIVSHLLLHIYKEHFLEEHELRSFMKHSISCCVKDVHIKSNDTRININNSHPGTNTELHIKIKILFPMTTCSHIQATVFCIISWVNEDNVLLLPTCAHRWRSPLRCPWSSWTCWGIFYKSSESGLHRHPGSDRQWETRTSRAGEREEHRESVLWGMKKPEDRICFNFKTENQTCVFLFYEILISLIYPISGVQH